MGRKFVNSRQRALQQANWLPLGRAHRSVCHKHIDLFCPYVLRRNSQWPSLPIALAGITTSLTVGYSAHLPSSSALPLPLVSSALRDKLISIQMEWEPAAQGPSGIANISSLPPSLTLLLLGHYPLSFILSFILPSPPLATVRSLIIFTVSLPHGAYCKKTFTKFECRIALHSYADDNLSSNINRPQISHLLVIIELPTTRAGEQRYRWVSFGFKSDNLHCWKQSYRTGCGKELIPARSQSNGEIVLDLDCFYKGQYCSTFHL